MATGTTQMTIGDSHRPLRDVICDTIRNQIMNGRFAPGSRLVEDRLAEELGVSRNPVREALRALSAEGFVDMVPRRGAVVAALADEEVEEIFELRAMLEGFAARLAARRRDDAQLAYLRVILEESKVAVEAENFPALGMLNSRFHELIVEMAGNSHLRDVIVPLRWRMQWIFSRTAGRRGGHSLHEHLEMADAIDEHDEDRAAQLAEHHIAKARVTYREQAGDGADVPGAATADE